MAGTMNKVKGSVKDAVGRATGNTRMQAEGKTDQPATTKPGGGDPFKPK